MDVYIVWLVSSCACALGIVAARSARLRRRARLRDLSWRGLIGLSLLAGALPAIVYSYLTLREIEVPARMLERTVIPDK